LLKRDRKIERGREGKGEGKGERELIVFLVSLPDVWNILNIFLALFDLSRTRQPLAQILFAAS